MASRWKVLSKQVDWSTRWCRDTSYCFTVHAVHWEFAVWLIMMHARVFLVTPVALACEHPFSLLFNEELRFQNQHQTTKISITSGMVVNWQTLLVLIQQFQWSYHLKGTSVHNYCHKTQTMLSVLVFTTDIETVFNHSYSCSILFKMITMITKRNALRHANSFTKMSNFHWAR